jgi:S-adenosylmethionine-diacylglycerol 3-amino-3-carboxypropyl transferase
VRSEVATRAEFSQIRYAQVWEDADILLEGLDIQPGHVCVSIASAGDNALAMLSRDPARVIALDLSPAQLACLELRVAAFRELTHAELLELIGSRPSTRRESLYARCRSALTADVRTFWDARSAEVAAGIGSAGKMERYFELFRTKLLPLIHSRARVMKMLEPKKDAAEREHFYESTWNTWRWRLLFRIFFSRAVMGRMGRDPSFFTYVEGSVADRIMARARHAMVALDPSVSPYLRWLTTGTHADDLPCALRAENFERIRNNLDRLEWHCVSVEEFLAQAGPASFDRYNFSDLFEYVSVDHYHRMLEQIVRVSRPAARLAYWNLLAERKRPEFMADRLLPLSDLSARLHDADRTFFYNAFVVEEVR